MLTSLSSAVSGLDASNDLIALSIFKLASEMVREDWRQSLDGSRAIRKRVIEIEENGTKSWHIQSGKAYSVTKDHF